MITLKVKNDYTGIYRAIVTDCENVSGTGKVRLRVPALHGIEPSSCSASSYSTNNSGCSLVSRNSCSSTKKQSNANYTMTQDLPWAYRSSPFPIGDGYGSYVLPQKGDSVWVMFEDCDPNKPVVIGCAPSTGTKRAIGESTGCGKYSSDYYTSGCNENISENKGSCYTGKCGNSDYVSCIYKSPKGAGIFINENDAKESLHVIDRGGQGLFFNAPIQKKYNVGNRSARGSATAIVNGGLPISKYTSEGPSVTLAGGYGQILKLSKGSVLLSCSESVLNRQGAKLDLKAAGCGKFNLSTSGSAICNVESDGTNVSINSSTGGVKLSANKVLDLLSSDSIKASAESADISIPTITFTEDVVFNGNIVINGNLTVSGNLSVGGTTTLNNLFVSGSHNIRSEN